ncbi:MAG: hypothetical protein IT335_06305 [Thermomicrobiales bacterium]|nr:hypothetical protein [Thermomicrobiales bacterium]
MPPELDPDPPVPGAPVPDGAEPLLPDDEEPVPDPEEPGAPVVGSLAAVVPPLDDPVADVPADPLFPPGAATAAVVVVVAVEPVAAAVVDVLELVLVRTVVVFLAGAFFTGAFFAGAFFVVFAEVVVVLDWPGSRASTPVLMPAAPKTRKNATTRLTSTRMFSPSTGV